MLTRAEARNNDRVPELPDLRILAEAFTAALAGRELRSAAVPQPLVLRGTSAELHDFEGRELERVEQRGKFLILRFGADRIVINAMLTGRLGLATPGSKPFGSTAVVFTLGPRDTTPAPDQLAAWTVDAPWLPADGEEVELRYRDPRRMGKVYLLPEGVAREVAGWDTLGPDVDDPALDLETWQARIRRSRRRAPQPAHEPGLRGRHRQRLQRRGALGSPTGTLPHPRLAGERGVGTALAGQPRDRGLGDRRATRTGATSLREAGA